MFAKLSCQKEEEEEGRNHNWNALDKQERNAIGRYILEEIIVSSNRIYRWKLALRGLDNTPLSSVDFIVSKVTFVVAVSFVAFSVARARRVGVGDRDYSMLSSPSPGLSYD